MPRSPQRGELYRVKADAVGKPRPIVIVSRAELNGGHSVTVVPLSTQQIEQRAQRPSCVVLEAGAGGLPERSVANCADVTLLRLSELDRNGGPLGRLDDAQMERINTALRWSLGLE
jgi:mRNA-degrading endonuclease toxin of MazEF toxin-antitoxin module